ncbi:MAG: hypothetical protein SAK29_15980 [Scytonema sp. PMC 1069.18]|nr:hypothetical protein [Scytonema sp. PMC 1069.18]MEC4882447.1 hypothetical protein [Scytonema sp. PMC 1070.18]
MQEWQQLGEIMLGMRGKPCSQVSLTDNNQLRLYLGTTVPNSVESELSKQEVWILSGQTTSWKLESMYQDKRGSVSLGHQTIATSEEDNASINQKIRLLEGMCLIGFGVQASNLEMTFAPQPELAFKLEFQPEPTFTPQLELSCDRQPEGDFFKRYRLILRSEKEKLDLPYWELMTPDLMVLKFGPGSSWSYTPLRSIE